MLEQQLTELLGASWFNLLRPYIMTDAFKDVIIQINLDRKNKEVIPAKEDKNLLFKAFKQCPYEVVKIVILKREPDQNYNNGLCYSVDSDYVEGKEPYEALGKMNLSSWPGKGVLLAHTSITTIKGYPGSHIELWKDFTKEWIERLSLTIKNIVWMFYGQEMREYEQYIQNKKDHYIIKTGYPHISKSGEPFDKRCFKSANAYLEATNQKPIVW